MTNQEIYTKVRRHLLKQNAKAMNTGKDKAPVCVYLADDGKKCAVGCLIPDTNYDANLESKGVTNPSVARAAGLEFTSAIFWGWASGPQIDLARRLQRVHDLCPVESWRRELDNIALYCGFKVEDDETP